MSTIEQNQQLLASVNSQNPDVNQAAATVNQYTELCKAGQLSQAEYCQLLEDIKHQLNINSAMIELDNLTALNTAISGLVEIASIAG
jgi:hypothetical protein